MENDNDEYDPTDDQMKSLWSGHNMHITKVVQNSDAWSGEINVVKS